MLLPVSILTCESSSASQFASAHQISYESDHWRRSYHVTKIFKMAVVYVSNQLSVPV